MHRDFNAGDAAIVYAHGYADDARMTMKSGLVSIEIEGAEDWGAGSVDFDLAGGGLTSTAYGVEAQAGLLSFEAEGSLAYEGFGGYGQIDSALFEAAATAKYWSDNNLFDLRVSASIAEVHPKCAFVLFGYRFGIDASLRSPRKCRSVPFS
jgi:hypothetical protein